MVRGPVRPPGQGLGDHDRRRGDLLQGRECKHLIAEEHLAAHPPSRPEVFLVLAPAAGLITATRRRPDDVLYPELARWYRVRDRSGGILMADADSSAFPPGERSP